jgi:hypothetical protein
LEEKLLRSPDFVISIPWVSDSLITFGFKLREELLRFIDEAMDSPKGEGRKICLFYFLLNVIKKLNGCLFLNFIRR